MLRDAAPKTLIEGIKAAENQLFTSTGRLFISGDEGIFELVRGPDGSLQKTALHTGESCFFGGLTEQAGTIYANCYDFTNAAVFAAVLSEKPQFRSIHRLPGVGLLNGLTSDGAGSLFLASSFDGRIIRLRVEPSNPLAIESQDVFDAQSGFLTNGLKYFDEKLYWTAFTDVNVAVVKPNGSSGPKRNLGRALTFFDDLYVDAAGLVVADYLNGSVVECDLTVRQCTTTPNATFEGPSSVQRANGRLGLPQDALIVTERTGNRVSVLEP
ncbi:MAG TPA: hypothetical protein VJV78_07485 [Polyangiales bacterium]|nr:hypothetical protein [Polyangiales bacterium]